MWLNIKLEGRLSEDFEMFRKNNDMDAHEAATELVRRALSGNVHQQVTGTVGGTVLMAHNIEGGVSFDRPV